MNGVKDSHNNGLSPTPSIILILSYSPLNMLSEYDPGVTSDRWIEEKSELTRGSCKGSCKGDC